MTDNEKAATFIGWQPNVRCARDSWLLLEGCPECGYGGELGEHDRAQPYMTDPRNYIKALERLALLPDDDGARIFSFEIHFTHHYAGVFGCRIYETSGPYNNWEHQATIGAAVVKALAALYDAEHKS